MGRGEQPRFPPHLQAALPQILQGMFNPLRSVEPHEERGDEAVASAVHLPFPARPEGPLRVHLLQEDRAMRGGL